MNLNDITVRDIELYKAARSEVVQHSTVNRELTLLSHMFRKAIDLDYYRKGNPVSKIKKYKEPPGRVRYLATEERISLLDECKRSENPLLYLMVFTALETGMRKGEQQKLKWDDINFERQSIRLKQTKNNEDREIPISDRLLPLLQKLYIERCSPYVFSKPDGLPYGDWRRSFGTACRNAGIENLHWHDLRHDYASQLVMAGVDIYRVQKLMGHKTFSMTARYAHLSQAHLLEAVNRLATNLLHLDGESVSESAKLRK
jgi:integrase